MLLEVGNPKVYNYLTGKFAQLENPRQKDVEKSLSPSSSVPPLLVQRGEKGAWKHPNNTVPKQQLVKLDNTQDSRNSHSYTKLPWGCCILQLERY